MFQVMGGKFFPENSSPERRKNGWLIWDTYLPNGIVFRISTHMCNSAEKQKKKNIRWQNLDYHWKDEVARLSGQVKTTCSAKTFLFPTFLFLGPSVQTCIPIM